MSVWIFETALSVVFFSFALPLALVPLVNRVYRTHGRFAAWPAVVALGSVGMACALVAFTLFPLPNALECDLRSNFDYWSTRPLVSTRQFGPILSSDGVAGLLKSGPFLQVLFNVLLFVPIGFLIHQQTRWRLRSVVAVGLGLSLAVELTQGTANFGAYSCPYRVAELDDLLWNTSGTLAGALLSMMAFRQFGSLLQPRISADLEPPSLRRRISAAVLDALTFVLVSIALQLVIRVVTAIVIGPDAASESLPVRIGGVMSEPVAALFVGLAVPLIRSDSSTPGQASVDIRPAALYSESSRKIVARRWLVRWLPLAVLPGLWPALIWMIELVVALRRSDRRSLAGRVGRSTTVTVHSHSVARPGDLETLRSL